MKLTGFQKSSYVDERGITRETLVEYEGQDASSGVPLLDLGALDLPQDLEDKLTASLQAVGIREYGDALQKGSHDLIIAALRTTLKLSVRDIITLCQGEQKLLQEAGYDYK